MEYKTLRFVNHFFYPIENKRSKHDYWLCLHKN